MQSQFGVFAEDFLPSLEFFLRLCYNKGINTGYFPPDAAFFVRGAKSFLNKEEICMNKRKFALMGVIAALMLSGCASVQDAQDGQSGGANDAGLSAPSYVISAEEAEKAALDHAGIAAGEATVIKTEYDRDDNDYDVEFTAGEYKYEYDIGAADGSVIEFSKKIIGLSNTTPNISGTTSPDTVTSPAKTETSSQSDKTTQPAQTTPPAPTIQPTASESGGITLEEAKAAALEQEGLTESGVTFIKAISDSHDARTIYEIKFVTADYEYEYKIDANSGTVLSNSKEMRIKQTESTAAGRITLDEAKNIALSHAGIAASEASFTKTKLDRDDGREEYDIEFTAADYKYEYEIDAESGTVLSNSKEMRIKQTESTAAGRITLEEAKNTALSHAGIAASEASFTKTKLDRDDGREEYDIEFTAADYKYEYEIDAESGTVLSNSKEMRIKQTESTAAGRITLDEAKNIALSHAGIAASEASFTKTKLDYDDGREEYDIEFLSDDYEYEYEIDSQSGAVLSNSKEARKRQTISAAEGRLTLDDAKNAALDHAGVSASDATFTKTKLDYDDGWEEYDIKFYVGGWKYEYTIDAVTGEIIEFDMED